MFVSVRLTELQRNGSTTVSALSDSYSAAPSLTSLFPFKVCMPSVAVVPLVITMPRFHSVTAAHIIGSDMSGLLTLVSALQKQIWKLSYLPQYGCNPVTVFIQFRQSKEMENNSLNGNCNRNCGLFTKLKQLCSLKFYCVH